MNFIGATVKILELPKQEIINSKTIVAKCRAQLSQTRKKRVILLVFWNDLAIMILNNFKVNDHILIEGYTSLYDETTSIEKKKPLKKVRITVSKIYPFVLNENRSIPVLNFPR